MLDRIGVDRQAAGTWDAERELSGAELPERLRSIRYLVDAPSFSLGTRYPVNTDLNSPIIAIFSLASLLAYSVNSALLTCCTTDAMRRAVVLDIRGLCAISTEAIRARISSRRAGVHDAAGTSRSASNAG